MPQPFAVAKDHRLFFAVAPVFNLALIVEGFDFGRMLYGIDKLNWTVLEGIRSTPAVVVGFQPALEILSYPT